VTQILFYCGLIETNNNDATGQFENEYKTTLRTKMTTRISHVLDKNKIQYYNDQIMILASSINSLNLDFPDAYQEGLKRLSLFNKDIYINFLNEQFDVNEKEMFMSLIQRSAELEGIYREYYNFNIKEDELAMGIVNIVNDVFKVMKIGNYLVPEYKKGQKKYLNLNLALKLGKSMKEIYVYKQMIGGWIGITKEEAENHPQKNIITQSIGQLKPVEPDMGVQQMEKGDYLVINSDGLTNMVSNDGIIEVILSDGSLKEKAQELVNRANNAGGLDNITVAIVHANEEDN
jgi:hypothetical protein